MSGVQESQTLQKNQDGVGTHVSGEGRTRGPDSVQDELLEIRLARLSQDDK